MNRPFGRGITLLGGLTITMVINHLVTGMILQVWAHPPFIFAQQVRPFGWKGSNPTSHNGTGPNDHHGQINHVSPSTGSPSSKGYGNQTLGGSQICCSRHLQNANNLSIITLSHHQRHQALSNFYIDTTYLQNLVLFLSNPSWW